MTRQWVLKFGFIYYNLSLTLEYLSGSAALDPCRMVHGGLLRVLIVSQSGCPMRISDITFKATSLLMERLIKDHIFMVYNGN
ncbi:hypothetical protein RUM43_002381 [Polyplax serrata]|uniref:Uncharacterized protein n=1 Tax=Polyplax serrata TaxID=468196 RepID=A0AAN8S971_POLSC